MEDVDVTVRLRVVVWNANMAVHRKLARLVESLQPDIAIIPECADEEVVRAKGGLLLPQCSMVWVGSNRNKGLGVFGFGGYQVSLAEAWDPRLEWVAPVEVSGPVSFPLLAVWASNHRASVQHPDHGFLPQPAAALAVYDRWIDRREFIMAGDFNQSVIWDRRRSVRNHSHTVESCRSAGLVSAYHEWFGEEQGAETQPTHYWRVRKVDGPSYHIDYLYMPSTWIPHLTRVTVGSFDAWVGNKLSDHVPLVADFEGLAADVAD